MRTLVFLPVALAVPLFVSACGGAAPTRIEIAPMSALCIRRAEVRDVAHLAENHVAMAIETEKRALDRDNARAGGLPSARHGRGALRFL